MTVRNRTFNRRPSYDDRSRAYNVADVLPDQPRSYTWGCAATLDQGPDGACVGFGWTHEALAAPKAWTGLTYSHALSHYKAAQRVDEWPGENYEGTSVIAGAKVAKARGQIGTYRWAFTTADAINAISRKGPAVLGVNWYGGMFDPDVDGYIRPTGMQAGGHCILARGISLRLGAVLLHNSWGPGWGGTPWGPGTALMTFDDFDTLLSDDGECCVPVERT